MRRREFITLLGGATVTWPLAARAQQPDRMRRIGVLMGFPESDSQAQSFIAAFRDGLQKLGWTDGRNIRIDTRWPGFDAESRQRFAKELVALQPDLILSHTTPTTAALLQETRTIPIVFATYRSGSKRFRPEPRAARWQRHRFHPRRAYNGCQVGGTAQGDCAARQPGRYVVQPGNGDICRLFPDALQSRRSVLRSGGDRSTSS